MTRRVTQPQTRPGLFTTIMLLGKMTWWSMRLKWLAWRCQKGAR